MAKTFTLSSHSYDGRYLTLTCSQTQDIANNKSTINWTLTSTGGSVNYYTVGPTTVTIGGTQVYYKGSTSYSSQVFPAAKGSTSGTITVSHGSDGSKSLAVSLSTAIYNGVVKSASGTWTLDSNPRKATLVSAPNFKDTDNPTITYSNLAGSAVSALEVGIYSADGYTPYAAYRSVSKSETSYTFNLTDAERNKFRAAMTTSSSLSIEFVIRTTIGGTYYYDVLYRTVSLSNDSISIIYTVTDINDKTVALTGDPFTIVRYASRAAATITVNTSNGATVTKRIIKNGTEIYENVSGATFNGPASGTFNFAATDSRGKNAVENYKPKFIEYIPPTCNLTTTPLDTSGNMTIEIKGNYFNGSFGAANNETHIQYRYKESGGSYGGWTAASGLSATATAYKATFNVTGLDYRKRYTIQARVLDKVHDSTGVLSAEKEVVSIPVFDWSEDDFKFNVPVEIVGDLTVNGNINITGSSGSGDYILEQGTSGNWTYRKWNSGIYECWARIAVAATVNTTWGNLYVSGSLAATNISFPITFTAIPMLTVNLSGSGAGGFLLASGSGSTSTTKTGIYEIARGNASSTTSNYAINYHAIGRWK